MYKVVAPPDLLLVKPTTRKEESVIILTTKEEMPTEGTVISVGCNIDDAWLSQDIIFKKFGNQAFKFNGVDYLAVKTEDVIANIVKV